MKILYMKTEINEIIELIVKKALYKKVEKLKNFTMIIVFCNCQLKAVLCELK
jgi:hypothetical protein